MPRPHLLLLHGALGDGRQLAPLAAALGDAVQPHLLEFEGHGATASESSSLSIEQLADDVLAYLDANGIERAHAFGYSMGGYVALHLATRHPARLGRITTLGTRFDWTPDVAAREGGMLDARVLAQQVPRFAQALMERHTAIGWEQVLERTRQMMIAIGDAPLLTQERLRSVEHTVLLMVGDRDTTVSVEETARVARSMPHGSLAVLPRTPHPVERAAVPLLASLVGDFLAAP